MTDTYLINIYRLIRRNQLTEEDGKNISIYLYNKFLESTSKDIFRDSLKYMAGDSTPDNSIPLLGRILYKPYKEYNKGLYWYSLLLKLVSSLPWSNTNDIIKVIKAGKRAYGEESIKIKEEEVVCLQQKEKTSGQNWTYYLKWYVSSKSITIFYYDEKRKEKDSINK